ncbi:hypothetical protein BDR05DRAFT_476343 [Suillus weaverae]|nr:hypothetical protein BDR05DRAFT_476343 [Suillus weaverae]
MHLMVLQEKSTLTSFLHKQLLDIDATQFQDAQLPGGFFDDTQEYSHHSSARRCRRALAPSRPRALLIGFSSLFHRFRSNTHETAQLQQHPTQGFTSKRRPHVVEVAAVRDKRSLHVAPPRSKKGKTQGTQTKSQQQAQSHSQASSLRPLVTAAPEMFTILTAVAATATAATSMPATDRPSHRAVVVDNPHWWIRLMLYICCASVNYTGDH